MYTVGAFLAPLIMTPFVTLANQDVSTGKHPFDQPLHVIIHYIWHTDCDACTETPCKNTSEPNSINQTSKVLDNDGNNYIFLGNI